MLSNVIIAKVVLGDLDLLFQGNKFETVKANANMQTMIDFDIFH